MENSKSLFTGNIRQFGMLFALVALTVFFQVKTDGLVLTSANMLNLLNGNAYILVLAIGMALVIIAGHIDLSVGSVAALTGVMTAIALRDWGFSPVQGVMFCLVMGAAIGAWQGFWVAYVGIPAFVVTLGGMMLFRGANQLIGQSNTIPVPADIQFLGAGYLPSIGPDTGFNNLTLMLGAAAILWLVASTLISRRAAIRFGGSSAAPGLDMLRIAGLSAVILFATYLFASGRPGTSFPFPGLILLCLTLSYSFITKRTVFGRHIYAVGGALHAAELSGVNSKRIVFLVMVNMSVLASLAGLMFIGRATASGPFDGMNWELDAISAVFIGGAAVSGGVGTVIGSVVGGLVMAVLNNGLQLMGVGADLTQVVKGLVLLLAVAFDVYNKTQGKPSLLGLIFRSHGASGGAGARKPAFARPAVVAITVAVIAGLGIAGAGLFGSGKDFTDNAAVSLAKGDFVGVAMPQKTSENWVLAEKEFKKALTDAGLRYDVQFANSGVAEQQNQILTMVAKGAKYIVIGAIDGAQIGSQVKEAKEAGAKVIAYDRMIKNSADVDYYVAYDNFQIGVLQGQALLEGLKKLKGTPPWTVELIAGSPDDSNSLIFFKGAMSVLKPLIDDGSLIIKSGQTKFSQASTQGWKAENAQRRMDTILAGTYRNGNLDGVLAPNDTMARAAITSVRAAGKDLPVVTGLDSEVESVKSIMRGEQYATIKNDSKNLVRATVSMVDALSRGESPEITDTTNYNNGVKIVPALLLKPQVVTLDNVHEAFKDDPVLKDVVK
ncbi:substrate-binding domain-containing protein [Maridesulfovibrio sp.]|uniref:substrate-binding domain-containing protein n=1 Tax=Maridesulfovibrio sp. TaxID=2795000 RepID=UPI002AA650CC|nr:substrate-binding domain-containing protein [Maridesulfovibrio sp.]